MRSSFRWLAPLRAAVSDKPRLKMSSRPGLEMLEDRCLLSASPLGDEVIRWNNVALNAEVVDHTPGAGVPGAGLAVNPGPVMAARALSIVHCAIYDAVTAIDGSYKPYRLQEQAPENASMDAAIAQAGHDTLVALYPEQSASFDAALSQDLSALIDDQSKTDGIDMGHLAAQTMMTERANDGNLVHMTYTANQNPGFWRPDPFHPTQTAYANDYGFVTPFAMQSVNEFPAPLTPPLNSPQYTAAYNEAKSLGGDGITTPTTRTADQTLTGIFWGYDGSPGLGVPPRLYNQIAQTIAAQERNTEVQNARMFALINMAMADGGIVAWNTKYIDNFWRPITAIRESDPGTGPTGLGDGNASTVGDPNWTPLGAPASNPQLSANPANPPTNFTPPFPAYTSGHATFGAALFQSLTDFYGTDNIPFTFTSDELNGVTKDQHGNTRPLAPRSFTSFSQAAYENAESRIYLGIHWGFDRDQGLLQGKGVANQVFDRVATVVLSPKEHFVTAAYRDLFARRVDPSGETFAVGELNQGLSTAQVVQGLTSAAEMHTQEINDAYRLMLKRDADPQGMVFFSNLMANGMPIESVQCAIAGSVEYSGSNTGFVDKVFHDALGRTAEAAALQFYEGELAQGFTRDQVAQQVFGSAEYRQKFIGNLYQEMLGRAADTAGLDYFHHQMDAGASNEQIIAALVGSAEYYKRETAR